MYYVYILKSEMDGKLYIGYTADLKSRIRDHRCGKVISTKHRSLFDLIFYEAYKINEDAQRRERYFKTSKGKSSLRMILQNSLK